MITILRRALWCALAIGLYAGCVALVRPDLPRLWAGLPRLAHWLSTAFPPDFSDPVDLARRAGETVAIATLGTTVAALMAAPLAILAARPVAPVPWLYQPVRALLDILRGIDGFVFALIFVAAVGLGPFAGMIGVALHSAGSIAKLWSETLEAADLTPVQAALSAGASRAQAATVVLLPETLPQTASALLYMWEFNIRASTVLGVVGAGGLGQELKNAVDLLDFGRVLAILLIIVGMVLAADRPFGLAAAVVAMTSGLEIVGLSVERGGRAVLAGVSLCIRAGEIVAIEGPSGAGKTTLLHAAAGLLPHRGRVVCAGRPALVFQQHALAGRLSARDNVLVGALGRMGFARATVRAWPRAELALGESCLARVGLAGLGPRRASMLSGGQRQRVAIARALAQQAPALLADEPVASLDPGNAEAVLGLLRSLAHDEGLAVLVSLHQPELAQRYADRRVSLADGALRAM